MLELRGVVRGAKIEPASHIDWKEILDHFEDGDQVVVRIFQSRSHKENNLFHAIIQQAWGNQRGGPHFDEDVGGWKMLKAWLLCNAGHCNITELPPGSITKAAVIEMRSNGFRGFFSANPTTGMIQMRTAKRVAFKDLRHPDFQPVKRHVFDTICTVIVPGVTIEQMIEAATGGKYDGSHKRKRSKRRDRSVDLGREVPPETT